MQVDGWVRRGAAVARGLGLGAILGVGSGALSAGFLLALDAVTRTREAHEVIVHALPIAGLVVAAAYERWGASVRAGNDLVLETLHEGGAPIPLRMVPMVLLGTLATHLFGGSAGREGTAVQMGAAIADSLAHRLGLGAAERRRAIAAGIAGGFGSVFGTPIAGAVFGLEVGRAGAVEYGALVPAFAAAVVGDMTTRALGVQHTVYPRVAHLGLDASVLGRWCLFALAVAATAALFVEATHGVKRVLGRLVARAPLRAALGGGVVVAAWKIAGTSDFLGLGVPTITRSFVDPAMPRWTFLAKLGFTSATIGSGFLGGEVTPLFFVGATLGNALARPLGLPLDLAAGVGLAAVFGAAANAPLALAFMAVELLGAEAAPHVFIVTVLAYAASGHRGIYGAQRFVFDKRGERLDPPRRVRPMVDQ